jgi:hypothetical protein
MVVIGVDSPSDCWVNTVQFLSIFLDRQITPPVVMILGRKHHSSCHLSEWHILMEIVVSCRLH